MGPRGLILDMVELKHAGISQILNSQDINVNVLESVDFR